MTASPSPRAIVVSQVPPPHHGSTIMTLVFLDVLEKLGFEPRLVDRRFSDSIDQVGRFSVMKIFRALGLLFRMGQALVSFRPAVCIFFITNRPASFVVDWMISELLRLSRTEVIAYAHTRGFQSLSERNLVFRWMVKRLLSASSQTVCLGESLTDDVRPWVKPESISTIPNTPLSTPHDPVETIDNRTRVLFLSNLIAEKGADTFFELSLRLFADYPELRFTIAGSAADSSVREDLIRAVSSSGAPNIEFWGHAEADQKWLLLSQAKVLVFPTRYPFEAQPLTIIEAMSVGTPTIAFDVGGIRDIVGGRRPGMLVDANDSDALELRLRSYLDDVPGQTQASHAALQAFGEEFTTASYSRQWGAVLQRYLSPAAVHES